MKKLIHRTVAYYIALLIFLGIPAGVMTFLTKNINPIWVFSTILVFIAFGLAITRTYFPWWWSTISDILNTKSASKYEEEKEIRFLIQEEVDIRHSSDLPQSIKEFYTEDAAIELYPQAPIQMLQEVYQGYEEIFLYYKKLKLEFHYEHKGIGFDVKGTKAVAYSKTHAYKNNVPYAHDNCHQVWEFRRGQHWRIVRFYGGLTADKADKEYNKISNELFHS